MKRMVMNAEERAVVCYRELDKANFLSLFAGMDGAAGIIEKHLKANGESEYQRGLRDALPQEDVIDWFCYNNGGREVHRAWRDKMLLQGRPVSYERMKWDRLDSQDQELDNKIAKDVIMDLIVWLKGREALMEVKS